MRVIATVDRPGSGASCYVGHQPAALTEEEGSIREWGHCNLPFVGQETEAP